MEHLLRDARHGLRALVRDMGFTLTVVLTLTVCIGANTAMFAIVHSVLLRPLPVPDADALVLMSNRYPNAGAGDLNQSSAADYYDRRRQVTALAEQAMFRPAGQTVDFHGRAERIEGMAVTPTFFPLIGVAPAHGRAFTEAEGETGAHRKVILSDGLWRQLYAGDFGAIGRELRMGGTPYTIVGVMPPGFSFVNPEVRYWVPLVFTPEQRAGYHSNNWHHIGRLRGGESIARVQAQIDALNAANLERMPHLREALVNAGFHTVAEPLRNMVVKGVEGSLYLLWGGAVFVLLIGALNIASLALARARARAKEMATRLALGATRWRLARQLLVENLLLGAAGGGLGIALGAALLRGLTAAGLDQFPRAGEVSLDPAAVAVSFSLALAAGGVIWLAPVGELLRRDVGGMLHDGSRTGTAGAGRRRLRQALVGAEIGFAFLLLAGAGLLLASFRNLLAVNPGFTAEGVYTVSTNAPAARYAGDGELRTLLRRSLEAVRAIPGVASAGVTTSIPFGGDHSDSVIFAEGHTMKPGESVVSPRSLIASPGYFETMQIRLKEGRLFAEGDIETALPVAIVDERLARHFWPGQTAIGRRFRQPQSAELDHVDAQTRWYTVIGVVASVHLNGLAEPGADFGAYYFPYAQSPERTYTFAVRTAMAPEALARAMQAALGAVDANLALFNGKTMEDRAALSIAPRRTAMLLAMGFGAVALLLAAIGIYGVLAYLVAQRRREVGIRIALGCDAAGVVWLVLREGIVLVAAGLAAGLAGAFGLRQAVAAQIFGVDALDPLVLAGAAAVLGLIALTACVAPARRALAVDPAVVLHAE